MSILFEESGMLTTVQDGGRFGYQQYGVSPAGPMDSRSFQTANILVGNSRHEGALEITYIGPKISFQESNIIAITGGDLSPMVNGQKIPMYRAVVVQKGDLLSFGGIKNGCRSYIAFSGGLDVPVVMGSRATLLRNKLGGIEGREVKKGDQIGFLKCRIHLPGMDKRKMPQEAFSKNEVILRAVRGPQDDSFTRKGLQTFFWSEFIVSNEFDRMGCRLEGDKIEHVGDGNIITDGIVFGSVQVPGNGQPIIMLADRQSTGGYTKIATVISVDLPKIAQAMPGFKVRFIEVSLETAHELYLRNKRSIDTLENDLILI